MEFFHVQLDAFAQSTVRFLIPSAEPDWRLSPHPTFIRLSPSYCHRRWHPSWALPCSPCRTQTRCCRWRVARCPFHSLWLPRLSAGYVRLTCGVPRAFDAPALGHPTPSNRWDVSALSLTSQAREVRVRFT